MELRFSMTPRLVVIALACLLALITLAFFMGMRVERVLSAAQVDAALNQVRAVTPALPPSIAAPAQAALSSVAAPAMAPAPATSAAPVPAPVPVPNAPGVAAPGAPVR